MLDEVSRVDRARVSTLLESHNWCLSLGHVTPLIVLSQRVTLATEKLVSDAIGDIPGRTRRGKLGLGGLVAGQEMQRGPSSAQKHRATALPH